MAIQDLEEQAVYLAREGSAGVAHRFVEAADRAFVDLLRMPEMAPQRRFKNESVAGLRMWPIPDFPNHLIFYQRVVDGIRIIRVLHAKRDVEGVLDTE